jgi:arginine deiminase
MILTQIDEDELMVFEPFICGSRKIRIVRIDAEPGREPVISDVNDLFTSLKGAGFDMRPVFCGNAEPVQQEREQWLSGNNFFAIAPGKILGYACNKYTMEALSRAGYEVRRDEDFLIEGDSLDRYEKLVIGISGVELARGGGGARCMTMPVRRQPL